MPPGKTPRHCEHGNKPIDCDSCKLARLQRQYDAMHRHYNDMRDKHHHDAFCAALTGLCHPDYSSSSGETASIAMKIADAYIEALKARENGDG